MEISDFPDHPFRHRDLASLGLGRGRVARAYADGLLRRPTRGVYERVDLPDSHEQRARALSLGAADHHVATDRTAAALLGVDVLTWFEHDALPPVETCARRGNNPTHRGAARGGSRDLRPEEVTEVGGVALTTPLRTAMDLGCNLRRRDALAAMIGLARAYGLTAEDLRAALPRFKGRRGVRQLRALIPLIDPRIESAREAWTWLEIHDAGLPMPEPQVWIVIDGVPTYRLDLAYPHARVCVEYNGWEAHEQTTEQIEYDAGRVAWLQANGWTVIVVRRGDFTGDALRRWIDELGEALRPCYTNRRW